MPARPHTTAEPAPAAAAREENAPRVLAAASVTVVLWASAFIAIRWAGPSYNPGSMALLRMLVGSVALSICSSTKDSADRREGHGRW